MKNLIIMILAMFFALNSNLAQNITIVDKEGKETEITYKNSTVRNKGVILNSGEEVEYKDISYIGTEHYDAYEKIMKKAGRKGNEHLDIAFTGDKSLYALKLEKLQKRRNDAYAVGGAGGLMVIIGALSGDRDLVAAGAVTLSAGAIAKDLNTNSTLEAQNDAIIALQEGQSSKKESPEEEYRREYGSENVDAILALLDKSYERALALAAAGETAEDANHRVAASWVKATIYADQGETASAEKEYEKLVILDPEVNSIEEARDWMELILEDLEEMRKG